MAEADIITGKLASGGRLDKALADATELSRERIKGLIAEGAGATGAAALLTGRIGDPGEVVVNVLSGCSVDMKEFSAICAARAP